MRKILLYILSVLLMSVGLTFISIYMNLFAFGYTLLEFVYFIIKRGILIYLIIGVGLIVWFRKERKK